MERKIVMRFRNGSRKDASEEFPVDGQTGIRMGRESVCEICFEIERDDVVSRVHCRIDVESPDQPAFKLTDLNSRNGTYVNRQRISGSVLLRAGDVVQLGPGGPEVEFNVSGYPLFAKPTRRETESAVGTVPATQLHAPPLPPPAPVASPQTVRDGPSHATVERMIQGSQNKQLRSYQLAAAGAVILVLAAAAFAVYRMKTGTGRSGVTPAAIAAANTDSVVFFEVGWKIVDTESGKQLYQVTMANQVTVPKPAAQGAPSGSIDSASSGAEGPKATETRPLIAGSPANLPVFVTMGGQLEPMLSTGDGGGAYRPIGGQHTGSGFIVSSDGFILTNRHVAATWLTRYNFPDPAGVVLQFDDKMQISSAKPIMASAFPEWVPANARVVVQGGLDNGVKILQDSIRGKRIEGRDDYMDVTLAKNRVRIPGTLARVSDHIDVAMVKIDIPNQLRKVEMFDSYKTIKPGDGIVVMGYPAVRAVMVGTNQSKDVFKRGEEATVIPDPILSVGNIGRIIRGSAGPTEATYSRFGDVYQLTVNSTGAGNSGGPVFDDSGRVIGIFTSSESTDIKIPFAVPIRYGIELMGTNKVM